MTIKARLKLAAAAPALMAVIITVSWFLANRGVEKARRYGREAQVIVIEVNEVNSLLNSYLLYHEDRPKEQLLAQIDIIGHRLEDLKLIDPQQERLVQDIRSASESMRGAFVRLVDNHERFQSRQTPEVTNEAEERLAGQMLARARGMVANSLRLQALVQDGITRSQQRVSSFALILVLSTILPVTLGLFAVMRNIARALARLRRGTEVVAAGDLSHRIDATTRDELGQLASAFDEMTRRLQESTVSRNALEAEIEERKRAQSELQEAQAKLRIHAEELEKIVARRTAKLQETIEELEHFSYAIVHDLRAPLRAMQGFAGLIEDEYANTGLMPLAKEYLRRIKKACNRMDQLITDALSYSKVAHGEFALMPVDLHALVQDLLDTYPNLQRDRAQIVLQGTLPTVLGNEAALTQCVSNLLGNAVKFAKPGENAKIRIWSEPCESPQTTTSALTKYIRLWVEDDGIGISRDAQARIFRMFERATTEHDGTGIGLAIVRKVVQRMGGDVGVESEAGQGSRFWVTLPAGRQEVDSETRS